MILWLMQTINSFLCNTLLTFHTHIQIRKNIHAYEGDSHTISICATNRSVARTTCETYTYNSFIFTDATIVISFYSRTVVNGATVENASVPFRSPNVGKCSTWMGDREACRISAGNWIWTANRLVSEKSLLYKSFQKCHL